MISLSLLFQLLVARTAPPLQICYVLLALLANSTVVVEMSAFHAPQHVVLDLEPMALVAPTVQRLLIELVGLVNPLKLTRTAAVCFVKVLRLY